MPDPIDDGREALDRVGPTRDLWAEATARAAADEVVPLAPVEARSRRGVWLAAAAVVALVAGTIGVLAMDDDPSVNTGPAARPRTTPRPRRSSTTARARSASAGEPIVLERRCPADPPLIDPAGQPDGQSIAHTALGSQVAEIHVPGIVRDRPRRRAGGGHRAAAGHGAGVVRPRTSCRSAGSPVARTPCGSFTVTVAGSTEDGNRHAAVDLAERILLPSRSRWRPAGRPGGRPRRRLAARRRPPSPVEPTDGGGLTFKLPRRRGDLDGRLQHLRGALRGRGPTLQLGEGGCTELACPTNPTSQAVAGRDGRTRSTDEVVPCSAGDHAEPSRGTTRMRSCRPA